MSRASTADSRSGAGAAKRSTPNKTGGGYFQRSELPLTSLAFLLPMLVLYELGTRFFATDFGHHAEQRIIAFNLLQDFFHLFGATGRYLPALAVVGVLLSWHIARADSWQVDLRHVIGMGVESLLLTIPLMGLGFVAARYLPLVGIHSLAANMLVLSIGAGVYEELVFRLIAFTVLSFLFVDVLGIHRSWSLLLIVVISALLFSAYHYLGNERFLLRTFAFRTIAGLYFGLVFIYRGFGITAGTHAAYDIIVVVLHAIV